MPTFNSTGYSSSLGHRRAQRSGEEHENLVDIALNQLRDDGVLQWHPTGPKVKFLKKGEVVTVGQGPADRLIGMAGRGVWLEVKAWQHKDRCTYRERLHQYAVMSAFENVGFAGAYLVRWHRLPEWRLHPLTAIDKVVDGTGPAGFGLVFMRQTGILVPETVYGVPQLYAALGALCFQTS